MVLREIGGVRKGEDVEDLREFLRTLEGSPAVHETVVLVCDNHEDEKPTWTYLEANASGGLARRRCLQCAKTTYALDSEARWTRTQMWACGSCGQSIAEVAAGLAMPDGERVSWVVLGVRCVECGRIDGATDFVVPLTPSADVISSL
jgi:hypothetical protein